MKNIVFFNNKGGVGKTTLLCNLAAFLSIEKRKKILIVDADPQCNSTTYMLAEDEIENIYDKSKRQTIESFMLPLRRGHGFITKKIQPMKSRRFKCDIIPGDPKLSLTEDLLASDWKSATAGDARGLQTTLVFKHLTMLYQEYDYIFFDVGPSLGAINRAIMLASDYFVIPMSVDVFSLMALENINLSLKNWQEGFKSGLAQYSKIEDEDYSIEDSKIYWQLSFAGYVMQQYRAKTVDGNRIHVKAYEKISAKIPEKIKEQITEHFHIKKDNFEPFLGEIQNLHSLVPMSQTSNSPIFCLKASDGVVGAHFAKVAEARNIYETIANNLLHNLGENDD